MTADILRYLLAGFLITMDGLAILYLSRRQLTWIQIAGWGLFILFIPVLGPFLVILQHPGTPRTRAEFTATHLRR